MRLGCCRDSGATASADGCTRVLWHVLYVVTITSSFDEVAEPCRLLGLEKCWSSFSLTHAELDQPTEEDATELCDDGASIEKTEEDDEEAVDAIEGLYG